MLDDDCNVHSEKCKIFSRRCFFLRIRSPSHYRFVVSHAWCSFYEHPSRFRTPRVWQVNQYIAEYEVAIEVADKMGMDLSIGKSSFITSLL